MTKALEDIVVLDLTHVLAGPTAVSILADFGANVIQIEPPGIQEFRVLKEMDVKSRRLNLWSLRRNRRSITLDLRSQKGKEIFLSLVKKADVIVQNYSAGAMERIGLGYDVLKEANPTIIYCAISGFGQSGPYKDKLAYDPIIQAASGMMALTGFPENPPVRAGTQLGDFAVAVYAMIGVLIALHYRDITGIGQMIDCAMFDSLCQWTGNELYAGVNITGKDRLGNQHPMAICNAYKTKDGHYLVIYIYTNLQWESLLVLLDKAELVLENWSFKTRLEHKAEIDSWIEEWVKSKTLEEVETELAAVRIAHHPVTRPMELLDNPNALAREVFVEVDDSECGRLKGVRGVNPKLSETPGSVGTAEGVPESGQHTEEVLSEFLGYDVEEIAKLREEGVV
jgi:CoA:oxalate CoA-transferase